jgi:hypothetical protein
MVRKIGSIQMKFAVFAGQDNKSIYVNPRTVAYVKEWTDELCEVFFVSSDHSVRIPLQAQLVASELEKIELAAR